MKNIYFYETSAGRIGIADNGEAITDLMYVGGGTQQETGAGLEEQAAAGSAGTAFRAGPENDSGAQTWIAALYKAELRETALIRKAAKQLFEYLDGSRRSFDIPLTPEGTPFQKAVWNALTEIPYGETRTYGEIAVSVGNPKACRAVGMANNKNPIAIMIPCHRVIGANGKLVGYAGGLDIKKRLLELEKR